MSVIKKSLLSVLFVIIALFVFSIPIVMVETGTLAAKIKVISGEVQNLLLLKENHDLKLKQSYNIDKSEQGDFYSIAKESQKYKTSDVMKLRDGGYNDLYFNDNNNFSILNSDNYVYQFCDFFESLIKEDPRNTLMGKVAFGGFFESDRIKYNKQLDNLYDTIKHKKIQVNGVDIKYRTEQLKCNKDGNNITVF